MLNSEQIREFFRSLADGQIINAGNQEGDIEQRERASMDLIAQLKDFGVGLPPMANC